MLRLPYWDGQDCAFFFIKWQFKKKSQGFIVSSWLIQYIVQRRINLDHRISMIGEAYMNDRD